jgi:hypothetical protein
MTADREALSAEAGERRRPRGQDLVRLQPPADPPVLNALAAKALLALLVNAHRRPCVTPENTLPWDKAG